MYLYQIFSILGALVIFGVIIDFIRRGLLKEKYSLLWLGAALPIIVLSIKKEILDWVALKVGVAYPPSLLFLIALIFIVLIMLHFSVVISILQERNKALAQELALLKRSLKEAGITTAPPAGAAERDKP